MIKVEKHLPPKIIQKLQDQQKKSGSRQFRVVSEIFEALKNEFHNKCAYCETKFKNNSFGEIEHFKPKTVYSDSIYDWNNLLLVCSACNMRKSKRFPINNNKMPLLVNPVIDNPEELFTYNTKGYMLPKPDLSNNEKRKAEITIHLIGLNRKELVGRRKLILTNLINIQRTEQDPKKTGKKIREQLNELTDDGEYLAYLRYIKTLLRR